MEGGASKVAKHSASEEARGHGEQEVSPEEAKQHREAAGSLEELQEAAKEFDDAETGKRLAGKFCSRTEVRRRGERDGEGAEEAGGGAARVGGAEEEVHDGQGGNSNDNI